MKKVHPVLIFKLEEVSNALGQIGTNYSIFWEMLIQALEKAYVYMFENFRNGHRIIKIAKILDYLKNDFASNVLTIFKPSRENAAIIQTISILKHLIFIKCHCTASILKFLKMCIALFFKKAEEFEPKSYFLDKKFPALSSHFLNNEAILFDQMHLGDHPSVTKIHKIVPKVDVVKKNNSFLHKINVYGDDGKKYSYRIMKDFNREESINHVKLMQLLENLNVFLNEDVGCAQNFLKFHFPRITFINTNTKLMLHRNVQISLQHVYQTHTVKFYEDDVLIDFLQRQSGPSKKSYLHEVFKVFETKGFVQKSATNLERLASSPLEYFKFREKVLKDISMLCAAEFLNIYTKKQMLIHKNVDDLSNVLHLEVNFDEMLTTSNLLTPCMREFLGPFRIGVMADNIFRVLSCLKNCEKSFKFVKPVLHLMEKGYSEKDFQEMENFVNTFVNRLKNVNKTEVQRFLESTGSLNLCHANQFVHLTF